MVLYSPPDIELVAARRFPSKGGRLRQRSSWHGRMGYRQDLRPVTASRRASFSGPLLFQDEAAVTVNSWVTRDDDLDLRAAHIR